MIDYKMNVFVLLTVFISTINFCFCSPKENPDLRRASYDARIVGGAEAYPAQFKFVAALNVQSPTSRIFCVGSLISNQWILTAAHCIYGSTQIAIQLGSNSLTQPDSNRLSLSTSSYVVHLNYNPATLDNDVGLIKLRLPIDFSDYIGIPDTFPVTPIADYQSVLAIGWGQVNESHTDLSEQLRWVLLSTISNQECSLTYGSQITDSMVCASGNLNEGPCLGDSGGPLVHLLSGGRATIVGVSSFLSGNGCESLDPSGYTRIYPYVDWILSVMAE